MFIGVFAIISALTAQKYKLFFIKKQQHNNLQNPLLIRNGHTKDYKMMQLKKQATRLKIQRFFKSNELVLFFHYNLNRNSRKNTCAYTQVGKHQSLQEIQTKLWFLGGEGSAKKTRVVLLKNRIAQAVTYMEHSSKNTGKGKSATLPVPYNVHQRLSFSRNDRFGEAWRCEPEKVRYGICDAHNISIMGSDVQNRLLRAINEHSLNNDNASVRAEQGCIYGILDITNKNLVPLKHTQPEESLTKFLAFIQLKRQAALFQGPSALLGIKSVSQLHEILKLYRLQNTLVLLGGIYGNQAISNIQVEKLDKLSKEKQILDLRLISCAQKPILRVLFSMSCHAFSLRYTLFNAKYRLIEIFNCRINQLSLSN